MPWFLSLDGGVCGLCSRVLGVAMFGALVPNCVIPFSSDLVIHLGSLPLSRCLIPQRLSRSRMATGGVGVALYMYFDGV